MCENETSELTYIWIVGEVALASLSRKSCAKVTVVKDKRGRFHGEKVLGVTVEKDGTATYETELCYHVETWSTRQRLWVPWTALRLAERGRPFYGPSRVSKPKGSPGKPQASVKKATLKMDPLLPFNVKPDHYKTLEFNAQYDQSHQPLRLGKENSFREFVRRGKEGFFDAYYEVLQDHPDTNQETLEYLLHVNASTEDKFELVLRGVATERELEEYLHQCWRYNYVHKRLPPALNKADDSAPGRAVAPLPWCLVCGQAAGRRLACGRCPATYHAACRRQWLVTIIHRKNPPNKPCSPGGVATRKVLSRTRTLVTRAAPAQPPCPSCMWGPKPGYDDVVWHKLGACAWWPARVLAPGDAPACLLARRHGPREYPLRYYGTLNHAWARSGQMCLFLPSHGARAREPAHALAGAGARAREPAHALAAAVMDAADDYIRVYLTY